MKKDLKQKIEKIIEENYRNNNFNINELANSLGIERTYLFRKTVNNFKCNPKKLLETKRLLFAMDLLAGGEKISYVAVKSGFPNPGGMRRAFKNRLGVLPREFKAECSGSNKDVSKTIEKYKSKLLD